MARNDKRPGASGGGQPTKVKGTTPTIPKPAPATPGGPNRATRKEEARREREALHRKMARRRTYRILGLVVAVLVIAGAVTGGVLFANRQSSKKTANEIAAAGCSAVRVVSAYKGGGTLDRAHIGAQGAPATPPALSTYASVPPASGPHNSSALPAGVYSSPPDVYRAIHSLEHASVIIWYRPGTSSSQLSSIKSLYSSGPTNDHVIVAPYNYPTQGTPGQLPAGKQMVMVAWHHMETCSLPSLVAAKQFVASYRLTTGQTPGSAYKGNAPEPGVAI